MPEQQNSLELICLSMKHSIQLILLYEVLKTWMIQIFASLKLHIGFEAWIVKLYKCVFRSGTSYKQKQ